jgi:hypothetical protein
MCMKNILLCIFSLDAPDFSCVSKPVFFAVQYIYQDDVTVLSLFFIYDDKQSRVITTFIQSRVIVLCV